MIGKRERVRMLAVTEETEALARMKKKLTVQERRILVQNVKINKSKKDGSDDDGSLLSNDELEDTSSSNMGHSVLTH